MPLCFWCVLRGAPLLCACDARIFLITHLSQNQGKYMETSCHCSDVHAAELDSESGSLYSWGLKLINHSARRGVYYRAEPDIPIHDNIADKFQSKNQNTTVSAMVWSRMFFAYQIFLLLDDDDDSNLPPLTPPSMMECIWLFNVEIS